MKKFLFALCILILITFLTACNGTFNGSRTGNENQFKMDYSIFNSSDSQSLKLEMGDVINAEIVSDAGKIAVIIQQDDEEPIYENDNINTSTFQVMIKKSGTYKITVIGKNAKGSVSFIKNEM